jgi:hypothetical protein
VAAPRVAVRGVPAITTSGVRQLEREALRALDVFREGRGLSLDDFVRRAVRRKIEELSGARAVIEVLTSTLD